MQTAPYLRIPTTAICALLFAAALAASDATIDEDWPGETATSGTDQVNEGRLHFIAPPTDGAVLHSETDLSITGESLETGWVGMRQCYRHLDAVTKTEVVYAYAAMRDLEITRLENIAGASIGPRGIELSDVGQGAALCLRSSVKVLRRLPDGAWGMAHGPYHRRFLDGYYPYHITLRLHFPDRQLRLRRLTPRPQDGFSLKSENNSLLIDAWFEGELTIVIELDKAR